METKILESLTPKQEALAEKIARDYIADLQIARKPNEKTIGAWLKVAYGLYDMTVPARIEIVDSPFAACKLATELTGEKQTTTDDCGIGDGGWVAFYDFFNQIGIATDEEFADTRALREFRRVAWDTILLDECAIIVRRPVALRVDDAGNLHGAGVPCIEWADGEKDYAWHGQWVSEKIALHAKDHSKAEYLAITNTEERRALSEIAGWGWVAELLGVIEIDAWTDPVESLKYKLLRCDNPTVLLLSKQSPRLKDKSQPSYLEPVHENLRTARAARKWQATSLTADECEKDPSLEYEVET